MRISNSKFTTAGLSNLPLRSTNHIKQIARLCRRTGFDTKARKDASVGTLTVDRGLFCFNRNSVKTCNKMGFLMYKEGLPNRRVEPPYV